MSRKRIIGNNIKYNALSQVIVFSVNLALFPFIVFHVGKEIYGIYLLVMALTGYLGVLELGVTAAVTKYVAELTAKGDHEGVKKIISASFSLFFAIGLFIAIILFILSFYFDHIFTVDVANRIVMRQLFWVAAVASLFIWPGKIFTRVLDGFQRYNWLAAIKIGEIVLIGASAYLVFSQGWGIVYFLLLSYLFIILEYVVAYIISRYRLIKSTIIFPYFNKKVFRVIFGFSFYLFLSNLVGILIFNFDSFVIGAFVSIAAITIYSVGFNLQGGFRVINSLLGSPLFPAEADMEGRGENDKQKELLFKGTKYITLIFVPSVIITIIFAELFINNWMGTGFAGSVLPAQILISFWIFNNTIEVGTGLLTVKGHVRVLFKISVLNALLNLFLSLMLVRPLGVLGVVLGTTIPMVLINFPLVLYQILKVLKINLREFFNSAVKNNLWVYLFTVILSGLALKIFQPANIFLTIVEMVAVYIIVILVGFRFFLSSGEREEMLFMIKS
ncbi:MAG: oligosaccharide flippase family protein [Candidatus Staskawiczbacteria bacterium]|jgi:O-antigen/teichoic acid export membrane protein